MFEKYGKNHRYIDSWVLTRLILSIYIMNIYPQNCLRYCVFKKKNISRTQLPIRFLVLDRIWKLQKVPREYGKLRREPAFSNPRVCQLYEWIYRNDKFPHLTFYAEMRWSLNATITGACYLHYNSAHPPTCFPSPVLPPPLLHLRGKLMIESESFL